MPATRSVSECSAQSVRPASQGLTSFRNMGCSSCGGPGSSTAHLPPGLCLEQHARRRAVGVVQLCCRARAHTPAFRCSAGMVRPQAVKNARMRASSSSSKRSSSSKARATVCLVRSSSVGPSPPENTSRSLRLHGKAHHAFQPGGVVAHHALKVHGDAKLRQLLRKELRVRVQNVAQQKLGAHGNDLCRQRLLPLFGAAARGPLCVLPSLTGTRPPQAFRRLPRAPAPPGRAWRPRPPLSLPAWALSWGAAG